LWHIKQFLASYFAVLLVAWALLFYPTSNILRYGQSAITFTISLAICRVITQEWIFYLGGIGA
jgi:hypothetical protein